MSLCLYDRFQIHSLTFEAWVLRLARFYPSAILAEGVLSSAASVCPSIRP